MDTSREANMHGSFFWYDVMTTDTKAAAKFYGDVVGWGAQDGGSREHGLHPVHGQGTARRGRADAASGGDGQGGARPAWMGYIHVDDVDAMASAVPRGRWQSASRRPSPCPASSASPWSPIRKAPVS